MIKPIGIIETPFKQKLGIPRQSLLSPSAKGEIILSHEFRREDCLRELDTFSHLWILFLFSEANSWRTTISPPKLRGQKRIGVFATRSPHRPNHIGMSVLKLDRICEQNIIHVSGVDLLDQTPILDIKPYIPKWDSVSEANQGWMDNYQDQSLEVVFSLDSSSQMLLDQNLELKNLLIETLASDPRPTNLLNEKVFKQQILGFDIHWHFNEDHIVVNYISQP